MRTVLASAADERYGFWLLNMVGSVDANSRGVFDRIVLYDLGLSPFQRRLADGIRGVEVRTVPPFVPHWRAGGTWKTWVWTHLDADRIFWLDAGATVLRSLAEPLEQVGERGYFVVGQGHTVRPSIPSDYYELYGIPDDLPDREIVAGGIIAFDRDSPFFERVVTPTYEDNVRGRNLGFSAGELKKLNWGLNRLETPIIRDCPLFRPGQTVLTIRFYMSVPDPVVNDVYKYGGWTSPRDHPEQLIWSHRRRGDYAYLPRVPYRPALAPLGRSWGLWFRWRWWARNHSWLFRPATYVRKARRLASAPFAR